MFAMTSLNKAMRSLSLSSRGEIDSKESYVRNQTFLKEFNQYNIRQKPIMNNSEILGFADLLRSCEVSDVEYLKKSLNQLEKRNTLKTLLRGLKDQNPQTRAFAAQAIIVLKHTILTPEIIHKLFEHFVLHLTKNKSHFVRIASAQALGRLATLFTLEQAKSIVPILWQEGKIFQTNRKLACMLAMIEVLSAFELTSISKQITIHCREALTNQLLVSRLRTISELSNIASVVEELDIHFILIDWSVSGNVPQAKLKMAIESTRFGLKNIPYISLVVYSILCKSNNNTYLQLYLEDIDRAIESEDAFSKSQGMLAAAPLAIKDNSKYLAIIESGLKSKLWEVRSTALGIIALLVPVLPKNVSLTKLPKLTSMLSDSTTMLRSSCVKILSEIRNLFGKRKSAELQALRDEQLYSPLGPVTVTTALEIVKEKPSNISRHLSRITELLHAAKNDIGYTTERQKTCSLAIESLLGCQYSAGLLRSAMPVNAYYDRYSNEIGEEFLAELHALQKPNGHKYLQIIRELEFCKGFSEIWDTVYPRNHGDIHSIVHQYLLSSSHDTIGVEQDKGLVLRSGLKK